MPSQGAAILSQIEGLMEQFLALDYPSPFKETVQQMLPAVQQGMEELRSQADGAAPPMGMEPPVEPGMEAGMPMEPGLPEPPAEPPRTLDQARAGAKEAMVNAQAKGAPPQPEDQKKKKKAKAK